MARRRRGSRPIFSLGVLLLGVVVGSVMLSVYFRTRQPASPPTVDPELRIEVLNGCGSRGAADKVAMLLRREGFQVGKVGNADHFHYREDIVAARTVTRSRVSDLGRILGGVMVVEQRVEDAEYDVTVIVGKPRSLIDGE